MKYWNRITTTIDNKLDKHLFEQLTGYKHLFVSYKTTTNKQSMNEKFLI